MKISRAGFEPLGPRPKPQSILSGQSSTALMVMITPFEYVQYLFCPLVLWLRRKPVMANALVQTRATTAMAITFFTKYLSKSRGLHGCGAKNSLKGLHFCWSSSSSLRFVGRACTDPATK